MATVRLTKQHMGLVRFAAAEASRFALNTVWIDRKFIAATDGKLLLMMETQANDIEVPFAVATEKVMQMLALTPITLTLDGNEATAKGARTFRGKTKDEQLPYPPVQEVIPPADEVMACGVFNPQYLGKLCQFCEENELQMRFEMNRCPTKPARIWLIGKFSGVAEGLAVLMPAEPGELTEGTNELPVLSLPAWVPRRKA